MMSSGPEWLCALRVAAPYIAAARPRRNSGFPQPCRLATCQRSFRLAKSMIPIAYRPSQGRVERLPAGGVCRGRFYDFLDKRNDRWGLARPQPIYEKDRLDPIDPAAELQLDRNLLAQFPEGYRHLAYLQTRIGYIVKTDMPGLDGPQVAALYRRGEDWLNGRKLE